MPSSLRACLGLLLVTGASALVFACSEDASPSAGTQSDDITGGTVSAEAAIVLVADGNDRYVCSGAIVASDVVALSSTCAESAASVYVGLSLVLDKSRPIHLQAPAATRIAVKRETLTQLASGCGGSVGSAFVQLVSATGVAPLKRVAANPAVGATCKVIGHGEDAKGGGVGEQRTALMSVKGFDACGELDAKGINGSIAVGQWDGMLVCNGDLAGVKRVTLEGTPTQIDNTVSFTSFGDPQVAVEYDIKLLGLTGPGPGPDAAAPDGGPPAVPGTACAPVNAITSASCGFCGEKKAICLSPNGGGASGVWSEYGVCAGEGCAPGTIETTQAGCAQPNQHRTRSCSALCTFSTWSACL